ncbi:MAG: endonuclease [Bacteroidota bacterium]
MILRHCFVAVVWHLCAIAAPAQIFTFLQGQELLDSLAASYKPTTELDYGDARDTLYSRIYKTGDSVTCVYSGYKRYLPPGEDPSVAIFDNGSSFGINCEHTFPQSKGAETGNPQSDMHHLFPTRSAVNTARSNDPFAEIPDQQTTQWYHLDHVSTSIPATGIEQYSEHINGYFEPREDHKGNVARAMFYFYTMYKVQADAADPTFFASQRETLCHWQYLDPADSLEIARTWLIAHYQDGKPNPYILDCTLPARSFCSDVPITCAFPPIATGEPQSAISKQDQPLTIIPNPARQSLTLGVTVAGSLTITDPVGRLVLRQPWQPGDEIEASALPAGVYFVVLQQEQGNWIGRLSKE